MSGFLCSMVGATFTVAAAAEVLRSKKGITAVGNAQVDTAQSKFGGASLLLDGTGDALSTAGIAFGTDAFTVEYWIRPTAQSSYDIHWDLRGTPTSNLSPIVYTLNGTLYVDVGATTVITGSALSNNTWYHIALARSGSSTKLFVDGTQVGSTYTDSNNYVSAATLYIGELYSLGGNGVVGNMDEFHISNSARYTTTFTPSTTAFINDANTLLLIHANGTDASTFFEDDNGVRNKKGISAVGNAQVDTAQSKFGGASALFDGTGDYLIVTDIAGGITEDQTFEFWIRFADLPGSGAFRMVAGDGGSTRYLGVFNDGGNYRWEVSFATGQYVERFATSLSTGVWYHVALTKSAATLKMYQAGTGLTSVLTFGTMTAAKTLFVAGTNYIGSWNTSSNFFNGHMDEIRVSNNVRYTTTFTPSTSPFVNDANTVLLMHMNQSDAATIFTDDNSGTVTTEDSYTVPTAAFTSDALTVALYHFENNGTDSGPNGYTLDVTGGYSSSVVKFGTYSGNLSDSTSDYFSHTTNRQWSPYNGSIVTDWTCEGYFYYTSWTGAAQDFNGVPLPNAIWIADVGGNRLPVLFGFTGAAHSPAGRLTMAVSKYSGGGGDPRDIVATSTTTYDLNTWHHIALTYNSTTGIFKGYINGAKAFTSSVPYGDLYTLPTHLTIGGGNAANSECYVDEVRISRMIRYGI